MALTIDTRRPTAEAAAVTDAARLNVKSDHVCRTECSENLIETAKVRKTLEATVYLMLLFEYDTLLLIRIKITDQTSQHLQPSMITIYSQKCCD